jgi:GAF domain-containing protein
MAAAPHPSISEKKSIRPQVSTPDFDSRTLEEITRSAQHATGASGAALVLSDGKIMSCRACSGELGPPVGTRLNTGTGFTATCVQSAEIVRCDDTATDPRVDGSSCIELGIRSILAVPVFDNKNVAGVLEVLSNQPKKFTDRHASALQLLARLVETVVDYGPRVGVSPETLNSAVKPQGNEGASATRDQATLMCLSCGHHNPRESQFCNRCGVILFNTFGPQATAVPAGTESSTADEGALKELCKLISGDAGLATWSEISERLLADQRRTTTQNKPSKPDDAVRGLGTAQGANGAKPRGASVRRSIWL